MHVSSLLKAAMSERVLADIQRLEGVTEGLLYELNREYEEAPTLAVSRQNSFVVARENTDTVPHPQDQF